MRRLSILLVSTSYPLDSSSVSGVFVARLVERLETLVDIRVLTPADHTRSGWLRVNGVDVYAFSYGPAVWRRLAHGPGGIMAAIRTNPLNGFMVPLLLASMFWHVFRMARKCDLVHANWAINGLIAGVAAKLLSKPLITTLRGSDITRAKTGWLDKAIIRLCAFLSTRLVVVSSAMQAWVETVLSVSEHKKIKKIENGVEGSFFSVSRMESHDSIELLAVSALIPGKGLLQLIDAMPFLVSSKPLRVTIVGAGEMREILLQRAQEKGVAESLCLLGSVRHEQICAVMSRSQVFVFTSYAEGRPNVVLEAMAAGLPIVASDIDGVKELVDDGLNGLLYLPDDVPELAAKINSLLASVDLRKSLGSAARDKALASGWTWEYTALQYANCYQSMMATKPEVGQCVD